MDSRDQFDKLVSDSAYPDRPEVRARSSIGLVSFVIEKVASQGHITNTDSDSQTWLMAWSCILCGLADDWPLVREAFQERLTDAFSQHATIQQTLQQPEFIDQIMELAISKGSAQEKMKVITGMLSLAHHVIKKEDGTSNELLATSLWQTKRINAVTEILMEGWTESLDLDLRTRTCALLAKSFTGIQLIQSLGALTASRIAQLQESEKFLTFCEFLVCQLSMKCDVNYTNVPAASTSITKDWTLTLWLCNQLWIPIVFSSSRLIEGSATNRDIAITFVKRAPLLMRCIEYILQLQSVDNTYALRRLVIACASFTNSSDLWNKLEQASSQITMSKAWENLVTIYETTPWTISNISNSTLPSPETEGCNSIKIPGSFSSNVIQIIEQEIRPCFTHLKAKKMVDRARTTIEIHKEKTKQIEAKMAEDSQGDLAGMTLMKQGQNGSKYNQKLMIAPVTDTPNDEENDWVAMDDEPITSDNFLSQSRSWNKTFLGSVPVLEWCAQQPIQDPSQIHEAFMHLVGPILTMIDSPEYGHRIRGLNILTSFLIEYYGHPVSSPKNNIRKQVDSRIWIKIFDRTGLDQVLERSLKPLLGPLQVALTRSSALEDDNSDDGKLDNSDELEAISAAFRAYLTLILVNTEENNKPTSASERTRPITIGHGDAGRITNAPLAVEDLFVYAVLGSFKRPNPSKEYRTLIMEWARILISPVISLDFLRESSLSVVPKRDALDEVEEQGFRGIYGMGSLTIKYLPTLIQYTCDVLGFLFPSSPFSERLKSLDLAWRTSDVLQAVMEVSTPRIPRYRGKVLASISNCWANSRIFPSEIKVPESDKTLTKLSEAQLRLDQSLIKAIQLCIEICRSKITDDTNNGLELDLKSLQGLDPAIFDPLFATE